jgi:hypothetical protein
MLGAVDLDNQLLLRTSEVDDIAGNRKLSAKAKPNQPVRAKLVPELQLGWCHDLAHRSGVCAMFWRHRWRHCAAEISALRRPPLSCRTSPPRGGDWQLDRLPHKPHALVAAIAERLVG